MSGGYRFLIIASGGLAILTALGTGAFFGALHAPHYSDEATRAANERAYTKQHRPSQIDRDRAGLPYFAERIASGPDPENGTDRKNRDLAARESMSIWAFWALLVAGGGLLVTTMGTFFLAWQVKLTREAVEDTNKATKAMVRQNDLAEAAQRPWVSIEVETTDLRAVKASIRFSRVTRFRNIGATVASNMRTFSEALYVGDDHAARSTELFNQWRERNDVEGIALMPGEPVEHWQTVDFNISLLPWVGGGGDERITLLVCAAAYYQIPGSTGPDSWRMTERTFRIGVKNVDQMKQLYLRRARIAEISAENAISSRTYPSRTT